MRLIDASPEHALWFAAFRGALEDYADYRAIYSDPAREWFASDRSEVGSFLWICELLEMNPTVIRGMLGKKMTVINTYGKPMVVNSTDWLARKGAILIGAHE